MSNCTQKSTPLASRLELGALHTELKLLSETHAALANDQNSIRTISAETVVSKVNEAIGKSYTGPDHHHGELAYAEKNISSIHDASAIRFRYDAHLIKTVGNNPIIQRSTSAFINAPTNLTRAEFAYSSLQLFAMDPSKWPEGSESAKARLLEILSNKVAFINGWETNNTNMDKALDITSEYDYITKKSFDASEILIVNDALTLTPDDTSPNIVRAHRDAMNAAAHLGIAPKQIIVNLVPNYTIGISAIITTAGKQSDTIAIDTRIWAPSALIKTPSPSSPQPPPDSSITISATGIRNDDNLHYLQGQCKRIAVNKSNTQAHRELGTHPVEAVRIAVPHIIHSIKSIGKVHLMSQIAKSILKLRPPESRSEQVAKLVCEQRGSRLKDEVRLANYYNQLKSELTRQEKDALYSTMQNINEKDPLQYKTVDGSSETHCFRGERGLQTVHNVHAAIRVNGGIKVPCEKIPGCTERSLKVHIDNLFQIESNMLAYC